MSLAAGSQLKVVDIDEVTFGTTPATPAMNIRRITGTTLELTRGSFRSAELTSTRAVNDLRLGMKQGAGDFSSELIYGDFDTWLQRLLGGTWTSEAPGTPNTLKLGTTKRSASLELGFVDIGQYLMFKGVIWDKLAISAKPKSNATCKWTMLSKDLGTPASATGATSTPAATTNSPMDTFSGSVKEGGSLISLVSGFDLNLDNQVEAADIIGATTIPDYFLKRLMITGTITAYFQDVVLLNKFLNETESSLELILAGIPTNKTLSFKLPRIKYTKGATPVNNDGGITMQLPFEAMYNTSDSSNIIVTRSNP
jgi:Phage tail tube protein